MNDRSGTDGIGHCETPHADQRRIPGVAVEKCLLLLQEAQCRSHGTRLPTEKETSGKRGQSLTLTVRVNESTLEDGSEDAVQPVPKSSGQMLLEAAATDGATVDTGIQVAEDSLPEP